MKKAINNYPVNQALDLRVPGWVCKCSRYMREMYKVHLRVVDIQKRVDIEKGEVGI
jgi:hypothetical protein